MGSKAEVRWVWAALDADTRQVVALIVGDRSEFTAECLWLALPDEYRDGATVHTDFLAAYRAVVPRGQHTPGGKGTVSPTTSSGSGVPSANGARGWSAKRCRSPSARRTTSARSGTSSALTTKADYRATTRYSPAA